MAVINRRITGLTEGYRQNIAIIGKESMGKSTILHNILNAHKAAEPVTIYIELKGETLRSFAARFIGSILYYVARSSGKEPKEDMGHLLRVSKEALPLTAPFLEMILSKLRSWENERIYENLLAALAKLEEDLHSKCIIMLDEFHRIADFGLKEPFRRFGESIMVSRNMMCIITSSACTFARKILKNEFSMLFGNFEIIDIGPFSFREASSFIEGRLGENRMDDVYKKFLFSFTGGNPFYLATILDRLCEALMGNKPACLDRKEVLAETLGLTIFDAKGILNQHFMKYMESFLRDPGGEDYALPLLAMTDGRMMRHNAHRVSSLSRKKIRERLGALIEGDLISKIGSLYRFDDKLLRFWLESSYYRKRSTLSSNPPHMSSSFKEDIEREFASFASECEKPIPDKIRGLFEYFDNETVRIKERNRKMVRFDSTEHRQLGGASHLIYADGPASRWAVFLKESAVNEDDILGFNRICNEDKAKIHRKIAIHLSEIDINALLMAKEFKMWVWDLKTVNTLMDLYGKVQLVF